MIQIVAPNYQPSVVGGAGHVFECITRELIDQRVPLRLHLNKPVTDARPEWREHAVVATNSEMQGLIRKAAGMLSLERKLPREFPAGDVAWFPFGMQIPATFRGPAVATVHDTLHLDLPRCVSRLERLYRRVALPRTMRNAHIITSSHFSAANIFRHFGVHAPVIALAADAESAEAEVAGLDGEFAFYPAKAWPHKNHAFLLE